MGTSAKSPLLHERGEYHANLPKQINAMRVVGGGWMVRVIRLVC